MGGHGEGEAHEHAGGVALDWGVEEVGDLGELDDIVELAPDLRPRHAEDRAVEVDVLATAEFRVKPRAHFEQSCRRARGARCVPSSVP